MCPNSNTGTGIPVVNDITGMMCSQGFSHHAIYVAMYEFFLVPGTGTTR